MDAILSDPYGLLIVCMMGGCAAVIFAFAATEFMVKLFPPSPNHTVKRGASRMSDDELRRRLGK
jgi:hypothetical protein